MKRHLTLFLFLFLCVSSAIAQQGKYFSKKNYIETEIPIFSDSKSKLPVPILTENSEWLDLYWKCWEIAFKGFKKPPNGSPLVSNWIDEAFSENIFQWDTIFMIMFARYAHDTFPAINSLDNFYRLQYESGFIGREFREKDGKLIHFDFEGGLFSKSGWKNMINPPLFSWAEVESFKLTGDKERLEMVLPALEKYAEWLNRDGDPDDLDWENNGRISKSAEHKLYWNTPLGSGMDNTPRPVKKGSGWVEMSAQMVIMYNNLSYICKELGAADKANYYSREADKIGVRINKWCWNDEDSFYYDVLEDGSQFEKMTSGGFWPLLAKICTAEQADLLKKHLIDEKKFWRKNVFPTLAADEAEYHEYGDYWCGGVWAPTNVMIIKGLQNYNYEEFAYTSTKKYLDGLYKVFQDSLTLYENYAPDHFAPGNPSKPDFVGWTGCGPIQLLIENILGLRPSGIDNKLTWLIQRKDRHGIEKLKLGNNVVTLVCEKEDDKKQRIINIESKLGFELLIKINKKDLKFNIKAGKTRLEI